MPERKVIPVRIGEVILYSKGLVIVKLKPDHLIEVEDVKEHLEAAIKLTKGSDFVTILDGGLTLDVSDQAMNYAAKHENKKWLAFAIIVRSISERLFANYYLKFKRPIRPTKVFTTPRGAEEWLKQFVPIEKPLKYEV
jgi:hypothetical protein